ncbi:MAG: hydroxymethylbilane synthase [Saprospiraceae bacterium]|nr:hydroxymethylbilane synthase [Saprospiraceae bacterium]
MANLIRIGSRGSNLALWQAKYVASQLESLGNAVEIKVIKTQGDKIQHLSFDKLEGKGFFTKELEEALLDCHIDLAVHSLKDLPTEALDQLVIAGLSQRTNPADWLLIHPQAVQKSEVLNLKPGASVGTSSLRRKSQLSAVRADLQLDDLRGNVPTRVQKLHEGQVDGIVLAAAGLKRLNMDLSEFHIVKLNPREFVPAAGQGVLAYQTRKDDLPLRTTIKRLHHSNVARIVNVERKILKLMEGGCHLPLGAYCEQDKMGYFHVWASFAESLEKPLVRAQVSYNTTDQLAEAIIDKLKGH